MKTIILFRHGEAGWEIDSHRDKGRKLTITGIQEAKKMGQYLARQNHVPDMVISSIAIRAKMTAAFAMESGKWDCSYKIEEGIYGGGPLFLLDLVKSQDNKLSSICLVGHEPNFSKFIAYLTDSARAYFPTASMAKVDLNVKGWVDITPGFGEIDWLIYPEALVS